MTRPELPPGFRPLSRRSPMIDIIGPVYSRGAGKDLVLGLRAEEKHCNGRGSVHGGALATIADIALGYALSYSTDPPTNAVTANLTLDYAGGAKPGDWLETQVDIQKLGKRLAYANCYISANGERIVRASAVFLVVPAAKRD
jgi:uncharacterized protein (TIGR00369 family)